MNQITDSLELTELTSTNTYKRDSVVVFFTSFVNMWHWLLRYTPNKKIFFYWKNILVWSVWATYMNVSGIIMISA